MKKVYCKNCKLYNYDPFIAIKYGYDEGNMCMVNSSVKRDYLGSQMLQDISKCKDTNKNCNCPHYQRKWWKFWIK